VVVQHPEEEDMEDEIDPTTLPEVSQEDAEALVDEPVPEPPKE